MNSLAVLRRLGCVALCCALFSILAAASSAAVLQVLAVGAKSSAEVNIDGVKRALKTGVFSDEGLLLQKVDGDYAEVLFNGETRRLRVGETMIVDTQTQGLPVFQVRLDNKGKYAVMALINGGSVKAEIERNTESIVIPSADADRLRLSYKTAPARTLKTVQPKAPKAKKLAPGEAPPATPPKLPDTYKTYRIELANVRIGTIDLYGLHAIVSEQPGLSVTTIGREFLKRASPSWSNGVLTLVRH